MLGWSVVAASASTVQLDWASGTHYDTTSDINSESSIYNAWPTAAVGLYVQDGYEVKQYGEYAYDPFFGLESAGLSLRIIRVSTLRLVRDVISRVDGLTFSLTSLDTSVSSNEYYDAFSSDTEFRYIASASFGVDVSGDGGTALVDPFFYSYVADAFGDLNQADTIVTATDFGGSVSWVEFLIYQQRFHVHVAL